MDDSFKSHKLAESFNNFIKLVGPGQFSYWRFAQWLIENEPYLVEEIIASALSELFFESYELDENQIKAG